MDPTSKVIVYFALAFFLSSTTSAIDYENDYDDETGGKFTTATSTKTSTTFREGSQTLPPTEPVPTSSSSVVPQISSSSSTSEASRAVRKPETFVPEVHHYHNESIVTEETKSTGAAGSDSANKILSNRMASPGGKDDIQFIEKAQPGLKNLDLKRYEFSDIIGFYPAFTYMGFYPPKQWHRVNIYYFLHSGSGQSQNSTNLTDLPTPIDGPLERHKSTMGLCSSVALSVIKEVKRPFQTKFEQCYKTIQNECASSLPSPIDIQPELAKVDPDLEDIDFVNYDHVYKFRMFLPDDGTDLLAMQLIPHESEKPPGLHLGGNRILYLDRVLFKVGFTEQAGSEHTIDGRQSGMELQFFFTPENVTYWEALSQYQFMPYTDPRIGQNVHAVSILVNVTKESIVDPTDAGVEYAKIFEVLSLGAEMFWNSRNMKYRRAIQFSKSLISLENIMREAMRGPHYIYEGSMTHPPCLPYVIWTVFENPVWITFSQWKRFALVHSEYSDDKFLAGNYRPLTSIMVKVNAETFKEMKNAEGLGEIEQIEIDRALNDRTRLLKNEPIIFSAAYNRYRTYFAMKVLKQSGSKDGKEFNYYELIGETEDGAAMTLTRPISLNVFALLIFLYYSFVIFS